MDRRLFSRLFAGVCLAPALSVGASADLSGELDRVSEALIEKTMGASVSSSYAALPDSLKIAFLNSLWSSHQPLFHKYYIRPQLGDRRYSVSDAFFERGRFLPFPQYRSEFALPDSGDIVTSTALLETTIDLTPQDPVALCALGYLYLEADRLEEAELVFIRALQTDRRMAEARNGRGLAVMKQGKRKREAIKLLEETVAEDPEYAAGLFDLALAHLGGESVDMHFHFDKVIKRFPNHYDAHYKLGAFYEIQRYFEESAAAYRTQVEANPLHWRAVIGLSRSAVELIRAGKPYPNLGPIEAAVENDPRRFLPYLGEVKMALGDYEAANGVYERYMAMLPPDSVALYQDLRFIAEVAERDTLQSLEGKTLARFIGRFWGRRHPLPTQEFNPRYLEHVRRVHYALDHYSEGRQPWDRRGEVYIRFGHPEHRSWSDHLVMATAPDVLRVKNQLNNFVHGRGLGDALEEAYGMGLRAPLLDPRTGEPRGMWETQTRGYPVFPVDRSRKWESWIYTGIDGGFEVVFSDELFNYDFDFAPLPDPQWSMLAPRRIVERARKQYPSVYDFDFGGDPMELFAYTADFASAFPGSPDLEYYVGVTARDVTWEPSGDRFCGRLDVEIAAFDSLETRIHNDAFQIVTCVNDIPTDRGSLLVDRKVTNLKPGPYSVAVQVRDPVSGRNQAIRHEIVIEDYERDELCLSDLVVATNVRETSNPGKFTRGNQDILALPSRTFVSGMPVFLFYEVYHLTKDDFGRTRYRVDYRLKGTKQGQLKVLRGLAALLGVERSRREVTFSYAHTGERASEPVYVSFNEFQFGKRATIELEVRVTDLNHPDQPVAVREFDFAVEK